jgi:hypothetical protein
VKDPQALVERIRELGPAEQRALVDALERVWSADPAEDVDVLLRRVGLVRGDAE